MKTLATYDYKKWGHQYIDRLVALGVPRNSVYSRLSRRMHYPVHRGHFGKTNNDAELLKMVRHLQAMVASQEKHRERELFVHIEAQKRRKQKAEESRLRAAYRALPWYEKLRLWIMKRISYLKST